jgi:hypothetical protein
MALLRKSVLKDWPPRYTTDEPVAAAQVSDVTESEVAQGDEAVAAAAVAAVVRKTRVRSLLKPDAPPRRKKQAPAGAV